MEKGEVATAAKGSVKLLNLSAKTQEKDFSTETQYTHIFRCNNLREAHSKRYTQK